MHLGNKCIHVKNSIVFFVISKISDHERNINKTLFKNCAIKVLFDSILFHTFHSWECCVPLKLNNIWLRKWLKQLSQLWRGRPQPATNYQQQTTSNILPVTDQQLQYMWDQLVAPSKFQIAGWPVCWLQQFQLRLLVLKRVTIQSLLSPFSILLLHNW